MNESTNNPLNDFLNQAEEEPENNLFAPIPFPSQPGTGRGGCTRPAARSSAAGARRGNAGNPGYPAGADASTGSNAFNHASPAAYSR